MPLLKEISMGNDKKLGLQKGANPGRELYSYLGEKKFVRYPIKTKLVLIGDKLHDVLDEFAKPYYEKGDVLCIASKIVSITEGYYIKEEDIKISWLAKFLVRFVKKWPNDPGFALPQKIQWSMDIVGMPRFILAMFVGGILKYLGKPGYFYRIAGHEIRSIDGFIPEFYDKRLQGYGFIAPDNSHKIANEIEQKYGMATAILDGNNVENVILGMSDAVKAKFSHNELLEVLKGNPQDQFGQTPLLLVREVANDR